MSNNSGIILTAALMHGLGNQAGAWRVRNGPASDYLSPHFYADLARKAEEGKLHALFLAETLTLGDSGAERPRGTMDTVATLSYMAAVTSRIGLVGTASTTYNLPYDVARRFGTLDHLANGRVGWNCVTTADPLSASLYGAEPHPTAEDRYARADEFIDVVVDLWQSWEEDALVDDKELGIFADPSKIHDLDHQGKYFSVRGALPFMRSRQGRPVIFHAGSSPEGRDQAARAADIVFTAQHTLEGAKSFRADIRRRAAEYGRDPDTVKVFPGVNAVLGRTQAEADEKKAASDDALTLEQKLVRMARTTGIPIGTLREYLDKPFPTDELVPDAQLKSGTGWRSSTIDLAVQEGLSVRQLLSRAPSGHHHIVGTAETVADAMQERVEAGAADGFTMMVDVLPDGMHDIVDLLVPELRRRGLFHDDYERSTLRELLGIGPAQRMPQLVGSVTSK